MAQTKTIQRMRFYLGSKLVAEVSSGTLTENTNNEQGHGTDGSNYFSQGNPTAEIDFSTVKPAVGYSASKLEDAVINQDTDVTMTGVVGDKVRSFTGTFLSMSHKTESKTGMLTGDFKYIAGAGKTVG